MRNSHILGGILALLFLIGPGAPSRAQDEDSGPARRVLKLVDVGPTGIAIKKPVFAGACKACPWGVLALITQKALEPYGYDVKICFVCWSNFGPREMADRTKPVIPNGAGNNPYTEDPPDAVPDISGTSLENLTDAWNGVGAYANDHNPRHNYRIIAVVHQPSFLMIAANKKSGITDLSQVKNRAQPTWIASAPNGAAGFVQDVMNYYGITEEGLKAHGGGLMRGSDRVKRASADIFIGGALLVNTPEQRMWYEVSQLADLEFFDIPPALIDKYASQPGYSRANAPIALLRGAERPIATVMHSRQVIYVRDDAPDAFTYAVAKALDEHQDQFRMFGDPTYYDIRQVADSGVIPMAAGAMKYYRERGYVK